MSILHMGRVVLLVTLMLLSGFADAQGFVHASNIWLNGRLVWLEVIKSAAGFGAGIVAYWISIRLLQDVNLISPEMQTIGWFTATILGVAIFSGKFLHWRITDQLVGVVILLCVAWLLTRTTG
ncbi:MAG: hypothetical protein JO031_11515 [Ktedonobacteraceae bacterium]|nr:hypothetical protein [Ktedonobacteraceae bacterium]